MWRWDRQKYHYPFQLIASFRRKYAFLFRLPLLFRHDHKIYNHWLYNEWLEFVLVLLFKCKVPRFKFLEPFSESMLTFVQCGQLDVVLLKTTTAATRNIGTLSVQELFFSIDWVAWGKIGC